MKGNDYYTVVFNTNNRFLSFIESEIQNEQLEMQINGLKLN